MNVWQGTFPSENSCADGFYGTCPVDAFPPNGYGLHNMTGNVWEWCADWFSPDFHTRDRRTNPQGPRRARTALARRLLSLPPLVLPSLSGGRPQRADAGFLHRERRLPLRQVGGGPAPASS